MHTKFPNLMVKEKILISMMLLVYLEHFCNYREDINAFMIYLKSKHFINILRKKIPEI